MKKYAYMTLLLCWGKFALAATPTTEPPLVESTVKARWPMLQRCYNNELRKGAVGDGKIVVGFQTNLRGYVQKAWIQEATIENEVVKRCVIKKKKKLKFKLDGENTLRGIYPISFSAKTTKQFSKNKPASDEKAKQLIDQAVQERWPKFKKCYLKEKIKNNITNVGTVMLHFVVNENGKVSHSEVQQSDLQNESIEQCIVDLFRTMRVAEPLHRIIQGNYPITFK